LWIESVQRSFFNPTWNTSAIKNKTNMILPIVAYGNPSLRKISEDIKPDYPGLEQLIADMFETMYASNGVGLAAPQINRSIRLFVVDTKAYEKDYPEAADFKKVFINARILEKSGEKWIFNEGCLSVPEIREDIERETNVRIRYQDEHFLMHEEEYGGVISRVIQHEYDHLEGILFVDKVSSLRKMLLKRKLTEISKGIVDVKYKMIFPLQKKNVRR
jgi:peptide deformylase